jgi:hypothetical protein
LGGSHHSHSCGGEGGGHSGGGGLNGSWHGQSPSPSSTTITGVNAVEVQTPEEALEVMVIAR